MHASVNLLLATRQGCSVEEAFNDSELGLPFQDFLSAFAPLPRFQNCKVCETPKSKIDNMFMFLTESAIFQNEFPFLIIVF